MASSARTAAGCMAVCAAAALAACQIHTGTHPVTVESVRDNVTPGETMRSEVRKLFGSPDRKTTSGGKEVWSYKCPGESSSSSIQEDLTFMMLGLIPYVGPLLKSARKGKQYTRMDIYFNDDGVVSKILCVDVEEISDRGDDDDDDDDDSR